ncbi:methyl-accepting chemotaxis protein [Peribacillus saganii]|uniref:Methyl-accepting chemotaxis protein n=1 Tax=Peribacillus saganii TaxID=2303992 RepID=A0A372LSH2_9BACI|nr:methyl-accepting chemotaxis protein [Peribacillus saganii]
MEENIVRGIKGKILIGFTVVLATFIAMSIITLLNVSNMKKSTEELISDDLVELQYFENLRFNMAERLAVTRGYLLYGDDTLKDKFYQYTKDSQEKETEILEYFKGDNEEELVQEVVNKSAEWGNAIDKEVIQMYENGDKENALQALAENRSKAEEIMGTLQELVKSNEKGVSNLGKEVISKGNSVIVITIVSSVAVILIGILIALFLANRIVKPIRLVTGKLHDIASNEGDLTSRIEIQSNDEIGELAQSFNRMMNKLHQLIQQVASNAEQVAAASEQLTASAEQTSKASEQISSTIQQVATGTESQVRSAAETSQTVNEISIRAQQIASNSHQAANTATEALDKAGEGDASIQTAINQMNSINVTVNGLGKVITELGERSKEIGQITEVITGISAQTNLLALNAAIEAARAGEQGKGFSVVAEEVRILAEQSSDSAQQISQLISMIQTETNKAVSSMQQATKEVIGGIEVVETAGISFKQIKHSISDVAGQIKEVSSAVQHMSAGTDQMVHSVKLITEMTEMTSAGTQEVSAATEEQLASMEEISYSSASLSKMAEELQMVVGRFKV